MRVLVCNKPGQFEYKEMDKPLLQKGHAMLAVKRIGICGTDLHAYEGTQPFFNYPRILGHELAAEIVEIEHNDNFSVGDRVTIIPYFNCGECIACRNGLNNCCTTINVFGVHIDGGMKEFILIPIKYLLKANDLSFDELALVEPLAIGAHGIRRAGVKENEFVLVMGAGPIGLGVLEFAKIAGANVIAMDVNEKRLQFCKNNLNVQHLINPSTQNVMDELKQITNNDMPTVIIDATGNLKAINNAFQYLAHGGRFVLVGLQKNELNISHPEFHKREATLMSSRNATMEDFTHVLNCMRAKKVNPSTYITHKVKFEEVKNNFESWLNPELGVIKAMVEFE
ncbi:MAG: zinc-binding alcohol dehydrogenase family protein [Ferruginibacter sp.]|nr:zinc-binding alcohol dehydrogenase family protein [Ferruginibacter sp.]